MPLPLADTGWNPKTWIARSKAVSMSEGLQKRAQLARENPREAAQQYDAARKSMFGQFATEPITPVAACIASDKAARRKDRLALVADAASCGCSADAADRLRADMDEVENMRVAKYVYLANDPDAPPELRDQPPAGFLKPTDEDLKSMGLTRDMLEPEGTSFRATVCVKDPEVWAPPDPPDPKYVLAFRGSTPELEDWENNTMQGADKTPGFIGGNGEINKPYHQRAVEIGKAVGKREPSPGVHFVGHSLGGGLASAAQGGSGGSAGKTASTYNAAGLNPETMSRYAAAAADPAKIKAVRVQGEVLTRSQEQDFTRHVVPKAVGTKQDIAPAISKDEYLAGQGVYDREAAARQGRKFDADAEYSTYLHGMDVMIASTEARKKADEATLRQCGRKAQ